MKFAKRLSELRNEFKLTQKELADKLGVSRGTIGMYEIGQRDPDTDTLLKLSELFNVSVDYLLGNTDIRNPVDEITQAVEDDPELAEFWSELKEREDLKLLFKQTKKLSPKAIRQVMRIIKAIEDEENGE
ncbi:transcriptional regulator [Thermoanaerobacterium sp. PSU-2]|uniref:helix-turn-helix domain-containing protein n=1 Tax=Thermoanaerobacterium sp. PSU-2 TaxID=1930849 RepID=UPI000A14EB5A|nr:helix-turn-helix transcriptional regulator [Thermoanaerobacterium sp. PSU-2]ORX23381.1 transcriptional regulator [Thermoanaerobacterium sp. PSU-2]